MRMELTPEAKEHLNQVSQKRGMTQIAIMSRMVEWFSLQEMGFQSIILGQTEGFDDADVARLILKKMAKTAS